jgi:hypothetical protein
VARMLHDSQPSARSDDPGIGRAVQVKCCYFTTTRPCVFTTKAICRTFCVTVLNPSFTFATSAPCPHPISSCARTRPSLHTHTWSLLGNTSADPFTQAPLQKSTLWHAASNLAGYDTYLSTCHSPARWSQQRVCAATGPAANSSQSPVGPLRRHSRQCGGCLQPRTAAHSPPSIPPCTRPALLLPPTVRKN